MFSLFGSIVLEVDSHNMQKGEGQESVVEWAEGRGGLSLRVKRDEKGEGFVVGWGGCECDGLV